MLPSAYEIKPLLLQTTINKDTIMKYLALVMVLAFANIQSANAINKKSDEVKDEILEMNVQEIIDFEKDLNLYIVALRGGGGVVGGRYFLLQDVRREVSQTRKAFKALDKSLSAEEKKSDKEYLHAKSILKDQQFILAELTRLENFRGAPRFRSPRRAFLNSANYVILLNAFLVSMKADLEKDKLDIQGHYFQRVPLN